MVVFETPYWRVVLIDEQTYLGAAVILLKRELSESLSDIFNDEWTDFLKVIKQYERIVKATFGATMFNWFCLMNNAYQNDPPNPHVHWHVRPRYRSAVVLGEETFEDPNFGHHYLPDSFRRMSPQFLDVIAARLRSVDGILE